MRAAVSEAYREASRTPSIVAARIEKASDNLIITSRCSFMGCSYRAIFFAETLSLWCRQGSRSLINLLTSICLHTVIFHVILHKSSPLTHFLKSINVSMSHVYITQDQRIYNKFFWPLGQKKEGYFQLVLILYQSYHWKVGTNAIIYTSFADVWTSTRRG